MASISAATITLRAKVNSTKSQSYFQARLYKSDGSTGLCTAIAGGAGNGLFAPTTSFSNLTATCSGLDTTVADWSGAILSFGAENDGNSNTFEVSEASVTLTVTLSSVPGAPTISLANDATNPTTAIDITITPGTGSPTGYDIQQASTLGGTFSTIATNVSSPYTVSGLTPGSEYAFQVAGVNGSGTGSYCSPVAWATEPTVPTSFSSPSASATAINVSFLFPSIGSNLSQTCEYRYETPVGAGNWVSGNIGNGSSPIPGLSPLTQYGIEIASVIQSTNSDWAGTIQGPWTSEITVITPPMPHATTFPISTAVRMSTTY